MWVKKRLGRVVAVATCVVSVIAGGASVGGAEQVGSRVSNVRKDTWLDRYHPSNASEEAEWIKGGYLFDRNPLIPSDWGGYPVYAFEEEMGKEILRLLGIKAPYKAYPVASNAGENNYGYRPNGYVRQLIPPIYLSRTSLLYQEDRDALVNPLLWKEILTGKKYWPYRYRFDIGPTLSRKESERLNYRIPEVFSGVWNNSAFITKYQQFFADEDGQWRYHINLFAKKGAPFDVTLYAYSSQEDPNICMWGLTITSPYVVDYCHVSSSIDNSDTWWCRHRRSHHEQ